METSNEATAVDEGDQQPLAHTQQGEAAAAQSSITTPSSEPCAHRGTKRKEMESTPQSNLSKRTPKMVLLLGDEGAKQLAADVEAERTIAPGGEEEAMQLRLEMVTGVQGRRSSRVSAGKNNVFQSWDSEEQGNDEGGADEVAEGDAEQSGSDDDGIEEIEPAVDSFSKEPEATATVGDPEPQHMLQDFREDLRRPFTFVPERFGVHAGEIKHGTSYMYWKSTKMQNTTYFNVGGGLDVSRHPKVALRISPDEKFLAVGSTFAIRGRVAEKYLVFLECQVPVFVQGRKKSYKGGPLVLCYVPWLSPEDQRTLANEGTSALYLRLRLVPLGDVNWDTVIPGRNERATVVEMALKIKADVMQENSVNPQNHPNWSKGLTGLPIEKLTISSTNRDHGEAIGGMGEAESAEQQGTAAAAAGKGGARHGPRAVPLQISNSSNKSDASAGGGELLEESGSKRGRQPASRFSVAGAAEEEKAAKKKLSKNKKTTHSDKPHQPAKEPNLQGSVDPRALAEAIAAAGVLTAPAIGPAQSSGGDEVPAGQLQRMFSMINELNKSIAESTQSFGTELRAAVQSGGAEAKQMGALTKMCQDTETRAQQIQATVNDVSRRMNALQAQGDETVKLLKDLQRQLMQIQHRLPAEFEPSPQFIFDKLQSYKSILQLLGGGTSLLGGPVDTTPVKPQFQQQSFSSATSPYDLSLPPQHYHHHQGLVQQIVPGSRGFYAPTIVGLRPGSPTEPGAGPVQQHLAVAADRSHVSHSPAPQLGGSSSNSHAPQYPTNSSSSMKSRVPRASEEFPAANESTFPALDTGALLEMLQQPEFRSAIGDFMKKSGGGRDST